jgi:Integrase core domain/Chromo (CHRromatin Organisation MOdifier) domain
MESVYGQPRQPGSFTSISNLQHYAGVDRRTAERFLMSQDAYTMHKPIRLRFPRRRTFSKGIDDLFQIDLIDLSSLSTYNSGHRYILMCIDVFSKYAWAVPLKTKAGREVADAMESILAERQCALLQADKGTEFLNSTFQSMLKRHGIKFYTSENEDIKASVVERLNRTIKERMFRYFTHNNTRCYMDVLQDIMHSYNNTRHRSIGMSPSQVDSSNEQLVREKLYPLKPKKFKFKYDVGDTVRISVKRQPYDKSYTGCWSEELFKVYRRYETVPETYGIKDLADEDIKGKFYSQELQKVAESDRVYVVEKILKTRKRAGKIEYFVKWRSYPDKFNSWTNNVETVLH